MYRLFYLFSLLLFVGCSTNKDLIIADEDALFQEEFFDTVFVTPEPDPNIQNKNPYYHSAHERKHDLIDTKLVLSFDWERQHVIGNATLTLSPYFYDTDELILDAKGFDLKSIKLNGKDLKYDYAINKIWITLDRIYSKDEKYTIVIDYIAKPNEGPIGGSQAITSDKGLFFINPLGTEDKPQQIWTQGETENNSKWFPTIDKPNERCTQDITLTVEDRFKTLSNGKLISSKKNTDGTRTDRWKQDQPHAPYLFMLAIGEYAVVDDIWKNLPLYYYVEPEYEDDAENIFCHTPEMLTFFSDVLDYPYPWDKYAQVICRDYVSGAMENTGAVVFGEYYQRTTNELIDHPNDNIVAHEMFHHWFGDLVTCESWSNLTLNEGFANYSEYLWQEHKHGIYAAEHHRINEMNSYLESAMTGGIHPLIDYHYNDKEDMFDAHSYNKGGLVLHMLRSIVGDEAFFKSLNKYLTDNAYTAVEADELRMAFEDVTGMDLNWFFDQWYFDQGHPVLEVEYEVKAELNKVIVQVDQVQSSPGQRRIFKLPVEIALYNKNGEIKYFPVTLDQRSQQITIPIREAPEVVVLDGKRKLLAIIHEERTEAQNVHLFNHSDHFLDLYSAINVLAESDQFVDIYEKAINHPYYYLRSIAAQSLNSEKDLPQLEKLLESDEHSKVRINALETIYGLNSPLAEKLVKKTLQKDKSYEVISKALDILFELNPTEALAYVDEAAANNPKPLMNTITQIYAKSGEPAYLKFFGDNMHNINIYNLWNYTSQYVDLATQGTNQNLLDTAKELNKNISSGDNIKKTILMYNLGRLAKKLSFDVGNEEAENASKQVNEMMQKVISDETNEELIQQYRSYMLE